MRKFCVISELLCRLSENRGQNARQIQIKFHTFFRQGMSTKCFRQNIFYIYFNSHQLKYISLLKSCIFHVFNNGGTRPDSRTNRVLKRDRDMILYGYLATGTVSLSVPSLVYVYIIYFIFVGEFWRLWSEDEKNCLISTKKKPK